MSRLPVATQNLASHKADLTKGSFSLSPLPSDLRSGLYGVTFLGFLSFFSCLSIQILLSWRMLEWFRRTKRPNQFFILIYNLFLADIQQSLAFLLNARWLVKDGIQVGTGACWAQGWFISTGDLASGAWCFFIGLHTFAAVVFNYRLNTTEFMAAIIGCWTFIYSMAIIGVAMHPSDYFVRAVAWCWVNSRYSELRLWLHYFWIFVFEFGTVLIYLAMYVTVQYRLTNNFYAANSGQAKHARSAAKLMIVYPIIYVICTLPLAALRMVTMTSSKPIRWSWFTFAGAMITSNGWLDVLLYTMTRRIMLLSDDPPSDTCRIEDTFTVPFSGHFGKRFGTKTTCEFSGGYGSKHHFIRSWWKLGSNKDIEKQKREAMTSFTSTDRLFDPMPSPIPERGTSNSRPGSGSGIAVKTMTTVEVRSEPLVELVDMREVQYMRGSGDQFNDYPGTRPGSDKSSLDFASKPDNWP